MKKLIESQGVHFLLTAYYNQMLRGDVRLSKDGWKMFGFRE